MSSHVVATCEGPETTLEIVEDSDFFAAHYLIREQDSGRVLREGISSRRSAVAAAEAVAASGTGQQETSPV